MHRLNYFLLLTMLSSCANLHTLSSEKTARQRIELLDPESQASINNLMQMIDDQSSITDPGAKHYVPYEFRIPLDDAKKKQVHRIDPSVTFIKRADSYQCIGDNAIKEKVYQIIALPYASKVKFCPYE